MAQEYDLSKLLAEVRDCWVALTPDQTKIVGRGETVAEAESEAKANGIDEPVLVWAPKSWTVSVYMGGRL